MFCVRSLASSNSSASSSSVCGALYTPLYLNTTVATDDFGLNASCSHSGVVSMVAMVVQGEYDANAEWNAVCGASAEAGH